MPMKILLIEDNPHTARTIQLALKDFYIVEVSSTGEDGEYLAQSNSYGALLVDCTLPDMDGVELCTRLRKLNISSPIIMVTGNMEVKNKVNALNSGADDYITKPFSIDELRARIEALRRRAGNAFTANSLRIADLELDTHKRIVTRAGKRMPLRRKEIDLLEYLMKNAGRVVSRSMIFDHVWESSCDSLTNVVDVHIKYLRDRIDRQQKKKLIHTVYGYGYKIEA